MQELEGRLEADAKRVHTKWRRKKCRLRVKACCCCFPIGCGTVTVGVLTGSELIAALIVKEWIDSVLQALLVLCFIVTLVKRHDDRFRRGLYVAYSVVLVLNFIELVAFVVVYLFIFDLVKGVCDELLVSGSFESDLFTFETLEECTHKFRVLTIVILVTGSVVYFPLKFHFALVLRTFYKEQRDRKFALLAQESARKGVHFDGVGASMGTESVELENLERLTQGVVGAIPPPTDIILIEEQKEEELLPHERVHRFQDQQLKPKIVEEVPHQTR